MDFASGRFAPHLARTEEGLIDIPKDRKIRDALWPPDYTDHPAKYSCVLVKELTEYLTKPGQTILDPMSGTGSTLVAALYDRKVICIELIEKYHKIQMEVVARLEKMGMEDNLILHGNCLSFLPIPADLVMFSPPYPTVTMGKYNAARDGGEDFSDYANDPFNSANCSEFMYWHRMEPIYKKLLDCAPLMAYTIRDSIRQGKRLPFVKQSIDLCESLGWKLREDIRIKAVFTAFSSANQAKGLDIVEDESILVFDHC